MGGGMIIKPLLDASRSLSALQINFLSGCTVLVMSGISLLKGRMDGISAVTNDSMVLALSGCVGGVLGKLLLDFMSISFLTNNEILLLQSYIMMFLNLMMVFYILKKDKILGFSVKSTVVCVVVGVLLGGLSSFLGIGGGAINIGVLCIFFSMKTKQAADNSLFMIFCAQAFSLLTSVATATIPAVETSMLLLMSVGGVVGAICGSVVRKRMVNKEVEKTLLILLVMLICVNVYNIIILKR